MNKDSVATTNLLMHNGGHAGYGMCHSGTWQRTIIQMSQDENWPKHNLSKVQENFCDEIKTQLKH